MYWRMQVAAGLQSALNQQQEAAQQLQGKLDQALFDKDQALKVAQEAQSAFAALQEQCAEDAEARQKQEAALREELAAAATAAAAAC